MVGFAIQPLHAAAAEQRFLNAPRRGTRSNEMLVIVEHASSVAAAQTDRRLRQEKISELRRAHCREMNR